MAFSNELRERLLLWCDRRCCLCKRTCDVFIELHHIVPQSAGGSDDEDNAMPLCFDCHAKVGHYESTQPRGNKFKPGELKRRREQVYEEHTRHLVPALNYVVVQGDRKLPDVGFGITHLGDAPPARVAVMIDVYVDGLLHNHPALDSLYRGGFRWNLNPKSGVQGHFPIVDAAVEAKDLRASVQLEVSDVYDRVHTLLPVTYVYGREQREWWLDPLEVKDSLHNRTGAAERDLSPDGLRPPVK